MNTMTVEIRRDLIIGEETQPTDGFAIVVREEGCDDVIDTRYYDLSWNEDDAIADALGEV